MTSAAAQTATRPSTSLTRLIVTVSVIALATGQTVAATPQNLPEFAPITQENCMAFSPARRAASGIICAEKQPKEKQRAVTDVNKASTTVVAVTNPILFATQVPTAGEMFASRTSIFANHRSEIESVPRGGDLMIRYPDGTLKNLTSLAGFGQTGQQGASAIAVRDPSVHWSGNKALFSMVIGAPVNRYQQVNTIWQLYEVTGLGKTDPVVITKVPGQPAYNNVTPLYDTNDNILFTSDRPRDGAAHLYPQLDEYESTNTITGLWRLDATTQALRLLNHTPSGLFSPTIDSFGRIIFTRWDHLQRDQQRDGSPDNGFIPITYVNETVGAVAGPDTEVFPESRLGQTSVAYGPVLGHRFNLFQPWEMNQDGTAELTMNHIGRHELSYGYLGQSFTNDPALIESTDNSYIANKRYIRGDGGVFQIKEDPVNPGTYYAIYGREFGTMNSGGIIRFNGATNLNAEQMAIVDVVQPEVGLSVPGGRLRDPLPLASGGLVAVHSSFLTVGNGIDFRLTEMIPVANNLMAAGATLTTGISKNVTWWSPDTAMSYNGVLWELEPVEVFARARPSARTEAFEPIEKQVLLEESVDEIALRSWLKTNNLALIVTRNQTHRDRADKQQPYNLRVPGGTSTTSNGGKVYDLAHYQIYQANQVRASQGRSGRRSIAQPIAQGKNPTNTAPNAPLGSVKIASDGSSAAFVPANRALTWQTTDPTGEPVVRERLWVTFQAGEIRTCAGCHGQNTKSQAGVNGPPLNKPQALRDLLAHWKTIAVAAAPLPFDIDGDGACNASTDAVLMMRYLGGARGAALTANLSFDPSAARQTPQTITDYLDGLGTTLDVDGDGKLLSVTDGLMFWRYTKLRTGTALITAAQNAKVGGGMKTDVEVKAYFDSKCVATP